MPRRLLYGLIVLLPVSTASVLLATGAQSPTPPLVLPAKHVELAAAPTVKGRDLAKLTP
jgi:hypothetical protein